MLALLTACTPPAPPPGDPGPVDTTTASLTETGSAPTGATGDTAPATADTAPATLPYDCEALPATGALVAQWDWPGFEDFTFGDDGHLWGVSSETHHLTRIPYGGPPEVLRPNVSSYARGTRFLTDGDLVSVDYPNDALIRIDRATYGTTLIAGGLTIPNGVAIGMDGFVYLSQGDGRVRRIDPVTGDAPVLVTSPVSNDGISFSPDYGTLYLDSDAGVELMSVGVDAAGAVTRPLALVANLPGVSDGMVVDACGNVYVTQFGPLAIVRVRTDGAVETFVTLPPGALVVALNFGSGLGGFAADHLFLADLAHGVYEIDAGVPGKAEPHLP